MKIHNHSHLVYQKRNFLYEEAKRIFFMHGDKKCEKNDALSSGISQSRG